MSPYCIDHTGALRSALLGCPGHAQASRLAAPRPSPATTSLQAAAPSARAARNQTLRASASGSQSARGGDVASSSRRVQASAVVAEGASTSAAPPGSATIDSPSTSEAQPAAVAAAPAASTGPSRPSRNGGSAEGAHKGGSTGAYYPPRHHDQNNNRRNGGGGGGGGGQQQHRRNINNGLSVGQTVVGRVVWANEHGAKVQILDSPITGYMPSAELPCMVSDKSDALVTLGPLPEGTPCAQVGMTRQFQVIRNDNKRGPLLSARAMDWDLLWKRAKQLHDASFHERENVRVRVVDVNSGGLLARAGGLQLFVPVSQLEKPKDDTWWSEEELRSQFTGATLEVAVNEIEPVRRKFVGSVTLANENRAMRQIKVGSLVWGTVRRVEPFGAFVGIDGTHVSGLVHISNISRSRVRRVDEIFVVGDRVHSLVMGIDEGYTNISLSTAELEVDDGDMLRKPDAVYAMAEEQQAYFLEHLEALQEEQAAEEELLGSLEGLAEAVAAGGNGGGTEGEEELLDGLEGLAEAAAAAGSGGAAAAAEEEADAAEAAGKAVAAALAQQQQESGSAAWDGGHATERAGTDDHSDA